MTARSDPTELAVFDALFASVAEEMGVTLGRTAHSPNIKERKDYSCAVFDAHGKLVAQAATIVATSWDAAAVDPVADGDVFVLERTNVAKTATGTAVYNYILAELAADAEAAFHVAFQADLAIHVGGRCHFSDFDHHNFWSAGVHTVVFFF